MTGKKIERRAWPMEVRVEGDGEEPPRIVGYAAMFDKESTPLVFDGVKFVEKIAAGAFAKTIAEADVRALINHDPSQVLGRTRAGTLRLAEDERGLKVEIDPPDTQLARDLLVSMRRGDVNQMSFGFQVVKDDYLDEGAKKKIRLLREVKLFDVSVVTFPAYPQTRVVVRMVEDEDENQSEPAAGADHSVEIEPEAAAGEAEGGASGEAGATRSAGTWKAIFEWLGV